MPLNASRVNFSRSGSRTKSARSDLRTAILWLRGGAFINRIRARQLDSILRYGHSRPQKFASSSPSFGPPPSGAATANHLPPSNTSAPSSPTQNNFMSSCTPTINLLFALPQGCLPAASELSILAPVYSRSPHWTRPNHLGQASPAESSKHQDTKYAVPLAPWGRFKCLPEGFD